MSGQKEFKVILKKGSVVVKEATRPSKYAAKELAWRWEENNPGTYAEIERA